MVGLPTALFGNVWAVSVRGCYESPAVNFVRALLPKQMFASVGKYTAGSLLSVSAARLLPFSPPQSGAGEPSLHLLERSSFFFFCDSKVCVVFSLWL